MFELIKIIDIKDKTLAWDRENIERCAKKFGWQPISRRWIAIYWECSKCRTYDVKGYAGWVIKQANTDPLPVIFTAAEDGVPLAPSIGDLYVQLKPLMDDIIQERMDI
ncbi:MAG: hypothetical protein WCX97_00135 [Candidatus Magasanikbacteria bacterium]